MTERTTAAGPVRAEPEPAAGTSAQPGHPALLLQAQAGNRAVARAVAVQRDDDPRQQIATAIASRKGDDVDEITSFASADPQQRVELAGILINDYGAVFGPDDRSHMFSIWSGLGDGLPDIVNKSAANLEIWKRCAAEQGALMDLPPVVKARKELIDGISGEARDNLQQNLDYVQGEKDKMSGSAKDGAAADSEAMAMVGLAKELSDLQDKRRQMLTIEVGFRYEHSINPFDSGVTPQAFRPGAPPVHRWQDEGRVSYDDVQALWDSASEEIATRVTRFPWLYALIKDKDDSEAKEHLSTLSGSANPADARTNIVAELDRQLEKVRKAQGKAASFDDWLHVDDLREVHRLGQRAKGRFQGWAADDMIGEQQRHDWWVELGLEVATDTAFVVAALATGGAATPLVAGLATAATVAIPAGQAVAAYEEGRDLKTMQDGVVLPGTDVVGELQVATAMSRARSKAIEALLNLAMAGKSLVKAASLELNLVRFGSLTPEVQAQTVVAALRSMDAKSLALRLGKTLPELATAAGGDAGAKATIDAEISRIAALAPAERTVEELALIKCTEAGDLLARAAAGEGKGMLESSVVKKAGDEIAALDAKYDAKELLSHEEVVEVAQRAFDNANESLAAQGVPPMRKPRFGGFGGAGEGTRGAFESAGWTVNYDLAELAEAMHHDKSTGKAISTFLHEAQHAEQAWTVARAKATDGMTAAEMSKGLSEGGLGIHPDVATQAVEQKLPKGSTGYERGQMLFKAEWNTAHVADYEAQQGLIDAAWKEMDVARSRWKAMKRGMDADPTHQTRATRQLLADAREAYDDKYASYQAEFQKYKDYASEAEAHAVEDAVLQHQEDAVTAGAP